MLRKTIRPLENCVRPWRLWTRFQRGGLCICFRSVGADRAHNDGAGYDCECKDWEGGDCVRAFDQSTYGEQGRRDHSAIRALAEGLSGAGQSKVRQQLELQCFLRGCRYCAPYGFTEVCPSIHSTCSFIEVWMLPFPSTVV